MVEACEAIGVSSANKVKKAPVLLGCTGALAFAQTEGTELNNGYTSVQRSSEQLANNKQD